MPLLIPSDDPTKKFASTMGPGISRVLHPDRRGLSAIAIPQSPPPQPRATNEPSARLLEANYSIPSVPPLETRDILDARRPATGP